MLTLLPSEPFTFDPARHLCLDARGEWIPSVTQILEAQGLSCDFSMVDPEYLEWKSRLGSEVHELTDIYDLTGDVDPGWLHSDNEGYYRSWIGFREMSGFVPEHVSYRRVSKVNGMRYTMELDKIGMLGKYPAILDLKCSEMDPPSWRYQTGAYEMGFFEAPRCGRVIRGNVRLKKDGSPGRLVEHKDHGNDAQQFLCALCNVTERIKHKLLKPPQ
jgi:hypothetical protein